MSKVYLPNKEQFSRLNAQLANIATALGTQMDISTWANIQKVVRSGVAPDILPVGTQLTVNHSVYGEILCDVVAHNYFKSAYDESAPTMTLLCHDIIASVQYDSPEAFYYTSVGLPAGTYNFTIERVYSSWAAGTYQFTLTKALPAYGQLGISGDTGTALTSLKVVSYEGRTTITSIESVPITLGSGGTSLGTLGVELNHPERVSTGSDNYKDSAIRQFLNSSGKAGIGSVWKGKTKYDRPPSWANSLAGFVGGFDDEFLSGVGEVIVPCSTNNVYECSDYTDFPTEVGKKYTLTDKFYLPSQTELFGTTTNVVEDGTSLFPYFEDATDTDRIKYLKSVAQHWWTRSPRTVSATLTHVVLDSGALSNSHTASEHGVVPCCTIV